MKKTTAGPGRPKSAQKRAAILKAAQRLFLELGFEGASMDKIAALAGVSKLTVYNHFTDKDRLFQAAVEQRCREQLPDDLFAPLQGGEIERDLREIGARFQALMDSPDSIALHRMMFGDARNAEHLGALFWNAGPARIIASLETFLRTATARGDLDMDDPHEAAMQFLHLLKGESLVHMICGQPASLRADSARHLDSVVRMFLRAYRPRAGG